MNSAFNKVLILIVFPLIFGWSYFVLFALPIHASTSTVSATVLDQSFNGPVLITPTANALVATIRPVFSWNRPTPLPVTSLNHYDFYLDGAIFASGLADSLTSVNYYFYTATASGGVFTLTLKTDLSQGYHTWSVTAFSDAGISASSETRTFYIDSIAPFISVTNIDTTTVSWTTADPSTIPTVENRYVTVTSTNPLVKGDVETSSNWKIVLICPLNIPSCTTQTYTTNSSTGLWEYLFSKLISGYTYTVKVSATDAVGNSTLFPDFFLTFGTVIAPSAPSPTAPIPSTITPSATASATSSAFPTLPLPGTTLTPPPGLLAIITPAPFEYGPPISPTPPSKKPSTTTSVVDRFYLFLIVLVVLGLPLHLLMSVISTETPLSFIPQFLFILAFPFLRNKKYRTAPFSFINIFIADKLDRPWQSVVSDIQGYYSLKNTLPENIFVNMLTEGRIWKDRLLKGLLIPISCLFSLPVTPPSARSRLLKVVYDTRIIPLIIACLSGLAVFIIKPSFAVLIYTYLSTQYLFSEYLYPKISN